MRRTPTVGALPVVTSRLSGQYPRRVCRRRLGGCRCDCECRSRSSLPQCRLFAEQLHRLRPNTDQHTDSESAGLMASRCSKRAGCGACSLFSYRAGRHLRRGESKTLPPTWCGWSNGRAHSQAAIRYKRRRGQIPMICPRLPCSNFSLRRGFFQRAAWCGRCWRSRAASG
jgi:hypothetical protein